MNADQSFEAVLDRCLDEVRAGRWTVEHCLARWPQHAASLEPLLRTASALGGLVVPDPPVDLARRAAFMTALAATPQQRPRRLGRFTGIASAWFAGWLAPFVRMAAIAAPTAAVAVALLLRSGAPAEAATLTVFEGGVERVERDRWVGAEDQARVSEGARLRTSDAGRAVLTFADGSTVAIDPQTEFTIERARIGASREIVLRQWSGRLWNQVAPYERADTAATVSFTVHTPDATVVAHGTVFETAIRGGETTVSTAEGLVEVQAGSQRQLVAVGEAATARPRAVAAAPERSSGVTAAEIFVAGPFAASLVGPDGRATGMRTDGVGYQQIPGAVSERTSTGQRLRIGAVDAGQYTLVLRRTSGGDGTLRMTVGGAVRDIPLGEDGEAVTVPLRIGTESGRTVLVPGAVPRVEANAQAVAARERVVVPEKQREQLERQRAVAAAAATAAPTRPDPARTPPAAAPGTPVTTTPRAEPQRTSTPAPTPTSRPTLTPTPRRTDGREGEREREQERDGRVPPRPPAAPARPAVTPLRPVTQTPRPEERRPQVVPSQPASTPASPPARTPTPAR